jgi:hypothetical protein
MHLYRFREADRLSNQAFDARSNNIAKKVTEARVAYDDNISIRFADGSTIKIPLKDEDYSSGEAVNFDTGGAVWWSL